MASSEVPAIERPHEFLIEPFVDFTATELKLRGLSIMLAVVYLDSGIGITGNNSTKLARIGAWLRTLKVPWAILGDWNASPDELVSSGWTELVRGQPVVPLGLTVTCTSGRGALLDYAVVSNSMLPLIKSCEGRMDTPWSPHVGIQLRLHANPRTVSVRKLLLPKTLEHSRVDNAIWAADVSPQMKLDFARTRFPQHWIHQAGQRLTVELNGCYYNWAVASEQYLTKGSESSATGRRGLWPSIRIQPLAPPKANPSTDKDPRLLGGASSAAGLEKRAYISSEASLCPKPWQRC